MGIQNSINRVLYYAGAFKIANKRNKYRGSKADMNGTPNKANTPKGGSTPKVKTQAGKLNAMRQRAFQSAIDEMQARELQRSAFNKLKMKDFGGMF